MLVILSVPSLSFAKPENASTISITQHEMSLAARLAGWDLPDFVRKWEFGIEAGENRTPLYFADLLIPLYRPDAEDRALFFEPRFNHAQGETLFNAGLGYRHLVLDRTWMLGGNVFFDHDTHVAHSRVGVGLEAISSYAELRANSYFGVSLARTIDPGTTTNVVEKPVDGFDLEAGFPVPYYHRLKLFGGYEWYDFKKFENREGWSFRVEYKPLPFLVLDLKVSDNNKRDTAWTARVAFRPSFGDKSSQPLKSVFKRDQRMFPEDDIGERLTDLVERHHEIVVEKYSETDGGVVVEVGRGT